MSAPDPRSHADALEELRLWDFSALRGAEFRRLLYLAHAEGLLGGLIRDIAFPDRPKDIPQYLQEVSAPLLESESRSIRSLSEDQDCQRNARGSPSQKSWFRLVSCGPPPNEITPEMIEAGVVIAWMRPIDASEEELRVHVKTIFSEMFRVARK